MIAAKARTERALTEGEAREVVVGLAAAVGSPDTRVLVLVPDDTRSGPLPLLYRLLREELAPRCRRLDAMVALGTHPPMTRQAIVRHFGFDGVNAHLRAQADGILQHAWEDPASLTTVGTLDAATIADLSGGRLEEPVAVTINRRALEYDVMLICGPTFPHEVVGFSGGNKYLFPGIAGAEIIDVFHWLGALMTSLAMIGRRDTPVRAVIDRAAALVPRQRKALCWVVKGGDLHGLYAGGPEEAFRAAADLSAQVNIRYLPEPVERVLSIPAPMYTELWTAAKAMYKLEPVVADGGKLVIYAPGLKEISVTHGAWIERVGYHVRDYFLARMEAFRGVPRCVLAHSTHVKGDGRFVDGMETPRIEVSLATAVPEALCRRINLGYVGPDTIDPAAWAEGEKDLVVPHAGEVLYRLERDRPGGQ